MKQGQKITLLELNQEGWHGVTNFADCKVMHNWRDKSQAILYNEATQTVDFVYTRSEPDPDQLEIEFPEGRDR